MLQDVTGARSSSARSEVNNYSNYYCELHNQLLCDTFSLSQDVRSVYKRHLLLTIDNQKLDVEYKKLKMNKLKLEIKKLEKEVSMTLNVI